MKKFMNCLILAMVMIFALVGCSRYDNNYYCPDINSDSSQWILGTPISVERDEKSGVSAIFEDTKILAILVEKGGAEYEISPKGMTINNKFVYTFENIPTEVLEFLGLERKGDQICYVLSTGDVDWRINKG